MKVGFFGNNSFQGLFDQVIPRGTSASLLCFGPWCTRYTWVMVLLTQKGLIWVSFWYRCGVSFWSPHGYGKVGYACQSHYCQIWSFPRSPTTWWDGTKGNEAKHSGHLSDDSDKILWTKGSKDQGLQGMTVCNIMFMHLTCIHIYDIGIVFSCGPYRSWRFGYTSWYLKVAHINTHRREKRETAK